MSRDINPLRHLLSATRQMSKKSLRVAKYILAHPEKVASMSMGELARQTDSNKTVVFRVSRLSGFQGYRELRTALLENRGMMRGAGLMGASPRSLAATGNRFLHLARSVVKIDIAVLQDALIGLDERSLLRAVETVLGARHVFLVGFGTSAPVVQDAHLRFLKLRISSFMCSDTHVLPSIIANIGPQDLLFCITKSGNAYQMVQGLKMAKERAAPTLILTSAPGSAAAVLSDTVLISGVRATTQTAVRVAQLVVIDIVCAIIQTLC